MKLTQKELDKFKNEVLIMLLASRDCYVNQGRDVKTFEVTCGYHGEAFGMVRALVNLGVKHPNGNAFTFGANNLPAVEDNAKWWFDELEDEALKLELDMGLQEAREHLKNK